MKSDEPIRLVGGTGSPYTQKMVALLRYRRLPYAVHWGIPAEACEAMAVEQPRPILEPTFFFENAGETQAVCDSTPIIRRLEDSYPGRSVLPGDPALAFIDYLIEDFADEWCTKYMFHYRWHQKVDADNASTLLPLSMDVSMPKDAHRQFKTWVEERQVNRLYVVGSNDATAPVIDASYRRFLTAMETHLANQNYMLGNRPAAGDFGLYGQLSQLVGFDPTARAIAHEVSPRTVAWVDLMRDQTGLEPIEEDWISLAEQPRSLQGVLKEIGRMYAPAQLANAQAVERGEKSWEAEIDGAMWSQQTFPYQSKCLRWTYERYSALNEADRASVNRIIEGTGIERMLVKN
ncbi:glutathione S-transferase [Halieaceae bacterium IMCC8485]|uniref:Glutathione S-transferase n=1 Tax=Candidatus Seongchinamella marina TaxID=2518990 RepID=A0ABT3SYC6_9GAMM|nr:glutathione S-transferase N-terminal domain-containing protein [Candidatus Seongchinamella marina]MCX2974994.1 glutathione S-transferase [Candidatus Seongchinamella marina]